MNPSGGPTSQDIAHIVERQMRNWELARSQHVQPAQPQSADHVSDFITVSRMVGAGGTDIACALGERLRWPVFDREILQVMAGDDAVRAKLYERMSAADMSWVEETLRWLLQGETERKDYFRRLSETVLALARQGPAVFLGRGADLLLPRGQGLRVRVVASLEFCGRNYAQRHSLTPALGMAEVERIQSQRREFISRHYHTQPTDPGRFDLVLNAERLGVPVAVELALAAARHRGLHGLPEH
jgi:cytidylate kinase